MKKIDISEKEYMVMMLFIHIVVHEDKVFRWNLQEYLSRHAKSEEDFDCLYDCILDFNKKELGDLIPRERAILLKFVGSVLVTWEKDDLLAYLCCENDVGLMKLAYIAFTVYNMEYLDSNNKDVTND
ncbi:hypothetical protein [Streptococcus acidominimus]|uniref:Uncharacterized protein n=1 Tax=Streptococcus acidominimus TaxID=1326 RepID=A0A1Q8EDM6_STRAI|nr:hypothetical protein [Streptococcus acidominimus]OLF49906.1 hypothetical protein BU200_04850 [Streptococcus acidominimus]SUN07722.1 Uncharacterised protein [Streptococcus acidominimus]